MERIIECVPNFSEGRDIGIINAIADAIQPGYTECRNADSVRILHIDRGEAANRTVITFAGTPEDVTEAAFRGVRKAAELIDMRLQHGTHPRSGATDVLPLVPVRGVTLDECAAMARHLAERIYSELGIPCYCYEAAAFRAERKRLEVCRSGEYEALPEKIADPDRRPDFSPDSYDGTVERSGAVNVGARDYLIAVNFNLDSVSADIATEIARDVRESGRVVRKRSGDISRDGQTGAGTDSGSPDSGTKVRIPGRLKGCKAIGWFIEEYGIAQVSMNITDIRATSLHKAYEEVCAAASHYGVRVTGTEIIGLVPEKVLLDAGEYFMSKAADNTGRASLIDTAIRAMGLDDLKPFLPERKVIEYCLAACQ